MSGVDSRASASDAEQLEWSDESSTQEVLAEASGRGGVRVWGLHLLLFVLTGAVIVWWWLPSWIEGLQYGLGLLAILSAHEMGHYVAARRAGVEVSLPYFIPGVPPFYTFGAFIKMRPSRLSRTSLLVLAAAGPIAGMLVAIPLYVVGLALSERVQLPPLMAPNEVMIFGDSALTWLTARLMLGPMEEGVDVMLHPLAYAGWVGFFVTALNLVPIGQLDGGHIGFALFGRSYHRVARALFLLLVLAGLLFHPVWLVLCIFLKLTGVEHPELTEEQRLPRWAWGVGALCLVFFLLTFVPRPIVLPMLYELILSFM